MKTRIQFFVLIMLACAITGLAQTYPEVTIRDIQFVEADSLNYYGSINSEPTGMYEGDTVVVTGVVMNSPYEGANPDSNEALHSGVPSMFICDPDGNGPWNGILVRDLVDAAPDFAILDTGIVVKMTGVVLTYNTTTQFNVINFTAQDVTGFQERRPEPIKLTLDSLVETGSGNPIYTAEKWEQVYVEIENVTVTDGVGIGYNSFGIFDDNNSIIVVGNLSDYWRNTEAPLPGTKIDKIRGFIETRTNITGGWFMINPVYPDDIVYGTVFPPNITNLERDIVNVGYGESPTITAELEDPDGEVVSAKLYYSVNESATESVDMQQLGATGTWHATIPAQNDSSLITYYSMATDDEGNVSYNPSDTTNGRYFFFILDRDLTVNDVQYSPFGSGYSGYNGYEVTLNGIVITDTSDVQGDGSNVSPQVYIQNGSGPWSGVQIFGTEADQLVVGDDVTVTGIVNESFGYTVLGTLDAGVDVVVNSSGNATPEPTLVDIADIASQASGELPAESYEGVLLKLVDVTVVDDNADGDSGPNEGSGGNANYGEIIVANEAGNQVRVEVQDGTHDYNNYWDFLQEGSDYQIKQDDTFDAIIGTLFYSFGNYKLVPRRNEDFIGWSGGNVAVDDDPVVNEYSLSQNYPNPFNPSTEIKYSLADAGNVKVTIYNIVGQEVMTLVDGFRNAGSHLIRFDASSLASGMYLYSIKANEYRSVKKMMLLK